MKNSIFKVLNMVTAIIIAVNINAQDCEGDKCASLLIDDYNRPNHRRHFVESPDGGVIYFYELLKKRKAPLSFRVVKFNKELNTTLDTTISFPENDIWSFELYGISSSSCSYLVVSAITGMTKSEYNYRYWIYKIDAENKISASNESIELKGYDQLSLFTSDNDVFLYSGFEANNQSREEYYSLKSGKKTEIKLIRFFGEDLKLQMINLNVPESIDYGNKGHKYSFWDYAYSYEGIHYFFVKDVINKSSLDYYLIGYNNSGEPEKELKLDSKIPNSKFAMPTYLGDECSSYRYGLNYSTYRALSKQYADVSDNSFYIFGFWGPKESASTYNEYNGFYIFKYDLKGQLIWKKTYEAVGEHAQEKHFKKNMGDCRLKLKRDTDGKIYVEIKSWPINTDLAGAYEITASRYYINGENGEQISSEMFNGALAMDDFLNDNYSQYTCGKTNNSVSYIQKTSPKNRMYWNLNFFELEGYQILAYFDMKSQEIPTNQSNRIELKLILFERD